MPLMGSLYIGTSGLQTSQNALNTVAHNLSNVDTAGYTRQQVAQSDKRYVTISKNTAIVSYMQTGLGTTYAETRQVRDYFLDKSFRKESGRSCFYEQSYQVMEEVEEQLGEMNGEAFQEKLTDLWTSIQELSKDPCASVNQAMLVQYASEFIERANAVYDGLSDYQTNLNAKIKSMVDTINDYGKRILELNDQIRTIESGETEHANDLKDERNYLLDKLGEMVNMSYDYDIWGNVNVKIEGQDFVKGGMCYEIGLDVDATTGFYTPFWPQNANYVVMDDGSKKYDITNAKVFNLNIEISSDKDTDVGGLKAILLARGDHRARYTDIDENYAAVEQSIVMNVEAEFDQLIHNVTMAINDVLAKAAGVTSGNTISGITDLTGITGTALESLLVDNGDGTYDLVGVKACAYDSVDGYMRNSNGSPMQLFTKVTTDGYTAVTDGSGNRYWVYLEEDPKSIDMQYTISNLEINKELLQNPSKLSFRLQDGSEDNATAEALKAAFTAEKYNINPNVMKKTTLIDYYTDLVSQVANSGSVYKSIYESQVSTVDSISGSREQVVGVSSDEELSNMIKFQNAYNAASRYINVINEMLEHIINTLAI